MAELGQMITLSVEDLEEQLGETKLPRFVRDTEDAFYLRTKEITGYLLAHPKVRAVLISGPTSSGKTTFTDRLVANLESAGHPAMRMSLDDYYCVDPLRFDDEGRPDYESLETIDTAFAAQNILSLLSGRPTVTPVFDFHTRTRVQEESLPQVSLPPKGYLLVEGLHGLSDRIVGTLPRDQWIGIFIMPWGEVVSDRRLIEASEIRMLRRIVRDSRNRGAHALATIDYWPMVERSEAASFPAYLKTADFFVNSLLTYESMVIAPLALAKIRSALELYDKDALPPSVFLKEFLPPKPFANLEIALRRAERIADDLSRIPRAPAGIVPPKSILNEFL